LPDARTSAFLQRLPGLLLGIVLLLGSMSESAPAATSIDDQQVEDTLRADSGMPGAGSRPKTMVGDDHPIAVVEKAPPASKAGSNVQPTILSSPRATMWSLGRALNAYRTILKSEGRTHANERKIRWIEQRIAYCFDLEDIAPEFQNGVATDAAVYLRAMMRRVPMAGWESIPDATGILELPAGADRNYYRMLDVPIELVRIQSGDREGNWVIARETRDRAARAYERIRNVKPVTGTGDLPRLHFFEPGWLIPSFLVKDLPAWSGAQFLGQSLWQWITTLIAMCMLVGILFGIYYVSKHEHASEPSTPKRLIKLTGLLMIGFLMLGFMHFLTFHVFLNGTVLEVFTVGSTVIMTVAFMAAILTLGNIVAFLIIAFRGADAPGIDPALIRVMVRSGSIVLAMILLGQMLAEIGFSPTTLLAGAGVTGLAFALAAQDTLKNFFASITLLVERPFREGDFVKIGSDRGRIEAIGLRSTSLRTTEGNVISLPNGEISSNRIENISRRPHIRCDISIGVTYSTPIERLKEGVDIIKSILEEKIVTPFTRVPRVHFSEFADSSLVIQCTYWQPTTDYDQSLAISEDVNLEILQRFREAQLDFAFPTMTLDVDIDTDEGSMDEVDVDAPEDEAS
jgi:MscS family membrane protein